MSLTSRWVGAIYRVVTTRKKQGAVLTPVGLIFWFGLSALLVLASLWLDSWLQLPPFLLAPASVSLGILLLVVGAPLDFWTIYSFFRAGGSPVPLNPPRKLVTSGLYSRIRNPMLLGWFIILFGLGMLFNSVSLTFIFTPLSILLNVLYLKNIEEREMEMKFGEQYLEYKRSVPMFIPRLRRWQ